MTRTNHQKVVQMEQKEIDCEAFAHLVLSEFPELKADFDEEVGLEHLQMGEFCRFTRKVFNDGDLGRGERCLRLADLLLRDGDAKIKNAVYVSYLERLPLDGEIHSRIRNMMTSDLQKGWDDILAYLSALFATDAKGS